MKLVITQASLSVLLAFAALFAGSNLPQSGNVNHTNVICSPPLAAQMQPKG